MNQELSPQFRIIPPKLNRIDDKMGLVTSMHTVQSSKQCPNATWQI